LSDGG
jgi:hypothetical protein